MSATTTAPPRLTELVPRLYASAPLRLPFGHRLDARAFLLEREPGNVLLYGAAAIVPHLDEVRALGGITRQYLNHSHEATADAATVGAPLIVHADDAAGVAAVTPVRATFTRRHRLDDDLEIIPVPGHTPGATAYLWDTGSNRVLFTGDTLFVRDGRWRAAILDGISDRDTYISSLELLAELDFDLLVPGIATDGDAWYAATDRSDAGERLAAVVRRLRAGADH